MRALFIICPSAGIGEIYTAIMLAEQLKKTGNRVFFIGTRKIADNTGLSAGEYWLFSENINDNFRLLTAKMKELKPDLVIFTDYHMLYHTKELQSVFKFEWLAEFQVPCFVIDTIGNCRFRDRNCSLYKDDNYVLTLPDWVKGILRPVPPHDPVRERKDENVFYFSVFSERESIDECAKREIKQEFGLSLDRKNVLLLLSGWVKQLVEDMGDYYYYAQMRELYLNLIRIFIYYLDSLNFGLDLHVVGREIDNHICGRNVILKSDFSHLSFREFDQIIKGSDLIITVNRFSNSLSRGAQYQIPTLSLINSIDIEVKEGKICTQTSYKVSSMIGKIMRLITRGNGIINKFMIFPVPNTDIIEEFCRKNPLYNEITAVCELFDEASVREQLGNLLFDEGNGVKKAQRSFMEKAYGLPAVHQQIEDLFR